ncbi:GGDEF domain-containing protein [Clostridium drakei]|uniref:GGDEF domain-containing protein n=1 Tax=Clostridium drakei TaxID=332101 RepID=A0A2U8DYA2_9CLOT|nr:GGDEF domain-containing protein [Clostridium drakei]AWI07254.1 GGDEF domain-containing protein [Clostridium drakei]
MDMSQELKKILDNKDITIVFQPIVSLKDGTIVGYEALTRGPKDSPLSNPEKLFTAAEALNKLWDLECLCRSKAIEKACNIDTNKLLFLNVDPLILKDEKFRKGFTKKFLHKYNMCPESIIFELTERTCIKDYKSFRAALDNYVEEGYKIAIDDAGAGYSGLKMISETKPHYIKIDIYLIRDIHKDSFKQHLIKMLVELADNTNIKLIAEGIEIEEELAKLIELGVNIGQGYFIQRPSDLLIDIKEGVKNTILKYHKQYKNNLHFNNFIGQIVRKDAAFNMNTPCFKLKELFDTTSITGVCIVDNYIPVGLIMKHSLDSMLATQYGLSIFLKRSVTLVMDQNPLIVDYNTPVSDVSNAAMERQDKNLYDYIIVTKDSKYFGIVTVKKLLQFTTTLERNYAKELNPLTGLPGNILIENRLKDILSCKGNFCVLYFDLDNFKVYNDNYGFENGDKIIKFTANLIQKYVNYSSNYNNFVGHIGGDDFIAIIDEAYDDCKNLCESIIEEFDKKILDFFNDKDKENSYIIATDRKGQKDIFDITSISIAGIYGDFYSFANSNDIAKNTSSIKKIVKGLRHSNYRINMLK